MVCRGAIWKGEGSGDRQDHRAGKARARSVRLYRRIRRGGLIYGQRDRLVELGPNCGHTVVEIPVSRLAAPGTHGDHHARDLGGARQSDLIAEFRCLLGFECVARKISRRRHQTAVQNRAVVPGAANTDVAGTIAATSPIATAIGRRALSIAVPFVKSSGRWSAVTAMRENIRTQRR